MSWYRETYLQSEDWKNLKAAVIAVFSPLGLCELCEQPCKVLDVHHFTYRKLYDVLLQDLYVVYRSCHDNIHSLLKKYPALRHLSKNKQVKVIEQKLVGKKSRWESRKAMIIRRNSGRKPKWMVRLDKSAA